MFVIKIFLTILLFLISTPSWATTFYIRVNGSTATNCTGTANSDYSGSGTGQACAFNNISWALGASTTAKMVGGDTVIIDDNGGTAQYLVGNGMPNTSGCNSAFPYSCVLNTIPSGTITNPTKIYGSAYNTGCATKPQLYGTQSVTQVLDLGVNSYIDIECLEITDHSNCGFRVGNPVCSESYPTATVYARDGIHGHGNTNIILKNLDIHGLAKEGMNLGDANGNMIVSHVNVDGNYFSGWDGDDRQFGGTGSINNGTINADYLNVRYNGCSEAYPRSGSFSSSDYGQCTDQNDNPPGYGDGLGSYNTTGNWFITNSSFSHNVQDGFDLLYALGGNTINIDKSLFEGNDGNQLKVSPKNLYLTNSILIANCDYFSKAGKVKNTSTWNDCRANGTPISSTAGNSGAWKFYNNTSYSSTGAGGSAFIEILDRNGVCTGSETYTYKNNVLVSNHSATNWAPYYNGLSGACSTAWTNATTDHSDVYNFTVNPSGTGNVFTDPKFTTPIASNVDTNVSHIPLQSSSPAKGAGASGVSFWNTSTDYNNFAQNSPVDAGGIQYGSSKTLLGQGQACVATTDCASGTCSNFACSGSCTVNGGGCTGTGVSATCCSAYCNAGSCANPPTCGDGIVQTNLGEVCDTSGPNLNGQTCISQGFTGGSLSCASNCLSFVTSSCTNTTVFPLTAILDTFTRANSTGLGSNWNATAGGMNISSNAALPTTVAGSVEDVWNGQTFGADEEAYVTISNKGSNGDTMRIHFRYDVIADKSYKLEYSAGNIVLSGPSGTLHTYTQAIASGDSIGVSVAGSTITTYYKSGAGAWTSLGTVTDTQVTAGGSISLGSFTGAGTPDIKFTNFGGGTINPIVCGNNVKEGTEVCDGTDLGGQTCVSQGFASGTLSCASNCQSLVTTSCVTASVCGNNVKESGEVCDGTDLASQTCAGLGFSSGTLTCNSSCLSFNTTQCVTSAVSGINGGVILK